MSAPEISACRFCGEKFKPAGIKNHERWCDQHPEQGMDPDRAAELGLLEDEEPDEGTTGDEDAPEADPHQGNNAGASLPERSTLPTGDKTAGQSRRHEPDRCPSCGGTDVIPADQALAEFRTRLERVPEGLETTLEATERYCNDCFAVSGGELPEPFDLSGALT